jgi:hypothetical protein
MEDTTIMAKEIRGCDAIIEVKDRQIANLGDVSKQKDIIIEKHKVAILDLDKKYIKSQKKVKIFKNIAAISASIVFILTGLLFIK